MRNKFSFSFFFVGLNSAFFIFREVFFPLKIAYILCNTYLALRSLYLLVYQKEYFSKNILIGKYFLYFLSLLVAYSFSIDFFIKNLLASLSIFLLTITFLKKTNIIEFNSFFLGYKISLIINFVYAGFELMLLLIFKISINNILFPFLGVTGIEDVSRWGRISGLLWDPFIMGIFCATSFFIFKNNFFKLYILVILLFSGSRSGLIGLIMAFFYFYYPYFINQRKIILAFIAILLLIPVIPILSTRMRFNNLLKANNSIGEMRRLEYYSFIPKIWASDNTFLKLFLGGAPFYTGARFYYAEVNSLTKKSLINLKDKWSIESDWSGILLGRGLIGFIYYLYIFLMIILNQKNRNLKAIAISILFAGIGYNYDLAIFINYILFFASSFNIYSKNRNILKSNEENIIYNRIPAK